MKILLALGLTFLVVAALRLGLDHRLPGPAIMALYLGSYLLLAWRMRRAPRADDQAEPDSDYRDWPTSGPIGRFGQIGLVVVFTATHLLCLLNPWQLVQVVRQLRGNARLQARERASGDDGRGYRCKVDYRLPFDGEWLLYNGGSTPKTSHSWDVLGQRFALDFVVADDARRRHHGRGRRPEEYLCWDQPILAAADGEVVALRDGIGDAPLLGWGVCDAFACDFIGNHLLIRHAEGEYALYAHLRRGSIAVGIADRVVAGQPIGRCGHSGHSTDPHLHFHLQDSPDLFEGMGLPVRFAGIVRNGAPTEAAVLTAGDRVRMPAPG